MDMCEFHVHIRSSTLASHTNAQHSRQSAGLRCVAYRFLSTHASSVIQPLSRISSPRSSSLLPPRQSARPNSFIASLPILQPLCADLNSFLPSSFSFYPLPQPTQPPSPTFAHSAVSNVASQSPLPTGLTAKPPSPASEPASLSHADDAAQKNTATSHRAHFRKGCYSLASASVVSRRKNAWSSCMRRSRPRKRKLARRWVSGG